MKHIFVFGTLAALSACGGSSVSNDQTGVGFLPSENSAGRLSGSLFNPQSETSKLSEISGSFGVETPEIEFQGENFGVTNSDGLPSNGVIEGPTGAIALVATVAGEDYEFFRRFEGTNSLGETVNGFVGTIDKVPTTGTAKFTGEFSADLFTSSAVFLVENGDSEIDIDFSNGFVGVTLSDFEVASAVSGQAVTAPFDEIKIEGAELSGNLFSGGSVLIELNGETASIFETVEEFEHLGAIYGVGTGVDQADEAAGQIFVTSGSNELNGTFVAD